MHTEYKEKELIISAMIDINNPYQDPHTQDNSLILEDTLPSPPLNQQITPNRTQLQPKMYHPIKNNLSTKLQKELITRNLMHITIK